MERRIDIFCEGKKAFIISLDSLSNYFSNAPITISMKGFDFDENQNIYEWYSLNVSEHWLKIFVQLIRKECSVFSDFHQLPSVHYDFFGIDIAREEIITTYFKDNIISLIEDAEKKEFIINNNIITISEILESIYIEPKRFDDMLFSKESKLYENIIILCEKVNLIYKASLSGNRIINDIIKDNFRVIHLEFFQFEDYFIFPNQLICNISNLDMKNLKEIERCIQINSDVLKISLLEIKTLYEIINNINDKKLEFIKNF